MTELNNMEKIKYKLDLIDDRLAVVLGVLSVSKKKATKIIDSVRADIERELLPYLTKSESNEGEAKPNNPLTRKEAND